MQGLLLKDFYMILRYCRGFIFIIVIFAFVSFFTENSMFFLVFPTMCAGMIPMTLISYDEREKWSIYCETMPYTRTQIVSAKYLIGLIFMITFIIIISLANLIKMLNAGGFNGEELLVVITLSIVGGIVGPGLLLPFIFRFGPEKGRIAYYVIIALFFSVSFFFDFSVKNGRLSDIGLNSTMILSAILIISVIIYACSWGLSVFFYKRREL